MVSALGSNRTMFDELCHRIMKFVLLCLKHHNCNSTVKFIIRNSLFFCRNLLPIGLTTLLFAGAMALILALFVIQTIVELFCYVYVIVRLSI